MGGATHSKKLAEPLAKLIKSENDVKHCIDIEREIYNLKYQFYNQFI